MENDPYPRKREIVSCCIHLRTKTQYYMTDEMKAGPGYIKVTGTGMYWCNKTSVPIGPDEDVAMPKTCQAGRECFERPESC